MRFLKSVTFLLLIIGTCSVLASKSVLILNSYHPQYKWTQQLTEGIIKTLSQKVEPENIHIEYMDGRRFSDDREYLRRIKGLMSHKYRHYKIDLIISTDDYAFQFLRKEQQDLFPKTPVVFAGVNFFKKSLLKDLPLFTGVEEGTSIKENIELIKNLYPKYKEIILLSDRTSLGLHLTDTAKEIISKNDDKDRVKIYDDFSFDELYSKVTNSKKGTYYLLLAIHHDNKGQYFSYDNHFIKLNKDAPTPIFSMWGILMGTGTIGGYMNNPYLHGTEVAKIGLSILDGLDPKSIPISKTQYLPNFDYRELVRYQISKSDLPENTKIHYRPITYYETHKTPINLVVFVIFILISFIVILNRLVIKRTKLANKNAENLAKSNAKMKDFVGIVAHDLRAPVGNIISFTNALEDAPEDHKEIVPYIMKSANKSINLINNILDISAIESGKVKINIEKVDLDEIIEDTIHEVTFLTKNKDLKLTTNLNHKIEVLADKQRVTQILQNLLTNAIKFTPKDGKIEILVEEEDSFVNVSVRDSGVGIPKELMAKLFKRTEFTSRSGTEGESGTGYGLPLVYNLVKEHGSSLTVESQEDTGSKFTFELKKAL